MIPSSEVAIDNLLHTFKAFQSMEVNLDAEFYDGLAAIAEKAMREVTEHTGQFLHNLDRKQPSGETLIELIEAAPESLSYQNKNQLFPIHSALEPSSINTLRYVPLLASEGMKYEVGGENGRGGLLLVHPIYGLNVLQILAIKRSLGFEIIKELREIGLLQKQDVKEHNLLNVVSSEDRLEYLLDFLSDRDGLKAHKVNGLPLIHAVIDKKNSFANARTRNELKKLNFWIPSFSSFFKVALKRHPDELGLLFQKDDDGITACERAFNTFGIARAIGVIGEAIPFSNPQYPILHYVTRFDPKFLNDFAIKYPTAVHMRDDKGRTLQQASLVSGNKSYTTDPVFFLGMSDDQVREKDPGSGLYPFMIAASGETCDLSAVYVLLRKNPILAKIS